MNRRQMFGALAALVTAPFAKPVPVGWMRDGQGNYFYPPVSAMGCTLSTGGPAMSTTVAVYFDGETVADAMDTRFARSARTVDLQ